MFRKQDSKQWGHAFVPRAIRWRGLAASVLVVSIAAVAGNVQPGKAQGADTSPTGMVAFFPQTECPAGWEVADYLQGRLAIGIVDTDEWTLGTQVGTALKNVTAPSHDHGFDVTLTLSEKKLKAGDCGGDTSGAAKKGDYPVNGPTESGGSADLPLYQILACEKQDSGMPPPTDGYGTSALAFFNLSSCPANWTGATALSSDSNTSNDVNGFFVLPFENPSDGTVGSAVGKPYNDGEQRKHTHTLNSSITLGEVKYEGVAGSCGKLTSDGTHSFSGTTDAAFDNVPYTQLLMCERYPNMSATNPPTGVPTNIALFYAVDECAWGWKASATGSGRFFVGLPENGTENEAFGSGNPMVTPGEGISHDHAISGSVTISNQKVALAKGTDSDPYGQKGTYSYGGSTEASDFSLPYVVVADCQPCSVNDTNPQCQEAVPSEKESVEADAKGM
ncbi:MAG: hypothetical protein NPIRA06_24760 [Nitrospirales bacterium]|nr:MAG: hypothetical protein NPIRA06_24760 [Nitrospirales bacterium]